MTTVVELLAEIEEELDWRKRYAAECAESTRKKFEEAKAAEAKAWEVFRACKTEAERDEAEEKLSYAHGVTWAREWFATRDEARLCEVQDLSDRLLTMMSRWVEERTKEIYPQEAQDRLRETANRLAEHCAAGQAS